MRSSNIIVYFSKTQIPLFAKESHRCNLYIAYLGYYIVITTVESQVESPDKPPFVRPQSQPTSLLRYFYHLRRPFELQSIQTHGPQYVRTFVISINVVFKQWATRRQ